MTPHAREEGLVVQEMDAETVVYDLRTHKAHCLNRSAALVWKLCDGRTTVADLAQKLDAATGSGADEQVVWMALERLDRARLLRDRLPGAPTAFTCSRRDLARRLGLVGSLSVLLPVVTSIVAPTPAQAGTTCAEAGQSCASLACCAGLQCVSNVCV